MSKKALFLRILRQLETDPGFFICIAAQNLRDTGAVTYHECEEFKVWVRSMIVGYHTVVSWAKDTHGILREENAYLQYDAYRKAWIAHLITYLENLP